MLSEIHMHVSGDHLILLVQRDGTPQQHIRQQALVWERFASDW